MSMGQAAGLAAIISMDTDQNAKNIDINKLQDKLTHIGAILEMPEKVADTSRHGWKNN